MTDDERRQLYLDFYDRIVGYFVKKYQFPSDEARDLAQDVFLGVFRTVAEMPFAPWVYLKTAAHNRAVNAIRSRSAHRKSDGGSLDAMPLLSESVLRDFWSGEEPASPETRASQHEEAKWLEERIKELPENLRSCVQLRQRELSYEEIATELGITVDAVRTRLRDAKRLLRAGGRP